MVQVRKSAARGTFDHGWLKTHHTFSFGRYFDRAHMGFRSLRVINEDWIAPGTGFDTHPHENMEIVSYVVSGELTHRDSMGNAKTLGRGEIQRMSAGTGIEHAEYNASDKDSVHLLQIWLLPGARDTDASYEQVRFSEDARRNRLGLIASEEGGKDGAVRIGQDVKLYTTVLDEGKRADLELTPGRHAWVQVVKGGVRVNGAALAAGDGAAVSDERRVELVGAGGSEPAEVLVFDLA